MEKSKFEDVGTEDPGREEHAGRYGSRSFRGNTSGLSSQAFALGGGGERGCTQMHHEGRLKGSLSYQYQKKNCKIKI